MVMTARVMLGWVDPDDLMPQADEAGDGAATGTEEEAGA
jgi:N utilization substance protein A